MNDAREVINRIETLFGKRGMNSALDGDPGFDAIFRTERMKEIRRGKMDQPTLQEWNELNQQADALAESVMAGNKWIAETKHKLTHFPRVFSNIQRESTGKRVGEVEQIIANKEEEIKELEIRMNEALRHYLDAQYGGKLTVTRDDSIIVLSSKRLIACPYPVWLPDDINVALRVWSCGMGLEPGEFFRDPQAFMKRYLCLDKVSAVTGKKEEDFERNEKGRRRRTEKTDGELFGEGLKKKGTEFTGLKGS
jgi:hypothetical protein